MISLNFAQRSPANAPSSYAAAFLNSPLFVPWTDPQSGVRSHILSKRVAPLQESFYFVNPSTSDDGRYYWFYCASPPAGSANQGRSLAVADLVEHRIHYYPETAFTDASPMVDGRTGEVYWCCGLEVWKRRPEPEARPEFVNSFPSSLARNRRPWRLATHLTFSADRTALNLDVEIGREWYVGHLPLDGGEFVLWQKFDRCYNHAQFSPADPTLQLIAQDHSVDPVTGEISHYKNRLWTIRLGETAQPVFPEPIPVPNRRHEGCPHYAGDAPRQVTDGRAMHGHEWWGRDGRHIWYVHYGSGISRIAPEDGGPELVWPHESLSHAHSDGAENWLVADNVPPNDPANHKVLFRNLQTGRQIDIVSQLPAVSRSLSRYHVHPHPQFCLHDQLVCFTTLVRGAADIAFVSVEELVERTS